MYKRDILCTHGHVFLCVLAIEGKGIKDGGNDKERRLSEDKKRVVLKPRQRINEPSVKKLVLPFNFF